MDNNKQPDLAEMLAMKLHTQKIFSAINTGDDHRLITIELLRVPGGWICNNIFVPEPKPFIIEFYDIKENDSTVTEGKEETENVHCDKHECQYPYCDCLRTPKGTSTIPVVDKKITVSDLERMKGELDEAWVAWDIYRETPQFDPETAHAGQFIAGYKAARKNTKPNAVVDYEKETFLLTRAKDVLDMLMTHLRCFKGSENWPETLNCEEGVQAIAELIRARQMSSPSDSNSKLLELIDWIKERGINLQVSLILEKANSLI